MLSISNLGGSVHYYLQLASIEYFHKGGEPPGQWFGKGTAHIGLSGNVSKRELLRLAGGKSPNGRKKLVQLPKGKKHQPGWDLTFSAPKSVSAAWAVADEELRRVIQSCHDDAVKMTLEYIEENLLSSRTGKGGKSQVQADMIAATFQHGSSRALDPQLHTHALILNVAVSEGKTRTIQSKPFYLNKMTLGALYRSELANLIQDRAGLKVEADRSSFRLRAVSERIDAEFSKRRQQMVEALGAVEGFSSKAAERVALETRNAKNVKPRSELFRDWQEAAARIGFRAFNLSHARRAIHNRVRPYRLVDSAFRGLAATTSTFSKSDLLRETALLGQVYGVPIKRLTKSVDRFIRDHREIVSVAPDRFTSGENLKLESQMIDSVMDGERRGCRRFIPNMSIFEKHFTAAGHDPQKPLTAEQQSAVAHITLAPGDVQLVKGLAGTGKTTALSTAAKIWEEAGYDVIGACIGGKAARELSKGGCFRTFTIAKLKQGFRKSLAATLWHHGKQLARAAMNKPTHGLRGLPKLTSKTVLVLDEAGMIGTQDLAEILREAAKAGAKVVLIGDPKQLQPIDKGTPFRSLLMRLGGVDITEIRRQHDAFDRQVVRDLYDGNSQDALRSLQERGRLHICENRGEAIRKMVDHWGEEKRPEDPIFVPTREEARRVNTDCQKLRMKRKELKSSSIKVGGSTIHVNDRVLFEVTSEKFGVANGDLGTVTGINKRRQLVSVKLDDGNTVMIPLKQYSSFSLGYGMTAHKGQGTTAENAFVLLGGSLQNQHLAYVQLSRARNKTHVYIDQYEAGEELEDLTISMRRNTETPLARDVKDRVYGKDRHHGPSY